MYKSLDPKKQNKVKENIKDYSDFTNLLTMTKNKSIFNVGFYHGEDVELIYVMKYRIKSGLVSESSIVIDTDMPRWIEIYEKEGFVKV